MNCFTEHFQDQKLHYRLQDHQFYTLADRIDVCQQKGYPKIRNVYRRRQNQADTEI